MRVIYRGGIKMKKKNVLKLLSGVCLCGVLTAAVLPSIIARAEESTNKKISNQDIIKMSEALNMSTDSEVYDIGTNPYRIFDVNNTDFEKLFVSSKVTDFKNYSFSGNSRAAISSEYSRERAFGTGVDINVPIYDVSANIDANFQTNISTALQTVNEEYYEYFERYQQTRVITTDWLSRD